MCLWNKVYYVVNCYTSIIFTPKKVKAIYYQIKSRYTEDNKRFMQVEKNVNSRKTCDVRTCTLTIINTTENSISRIIVYLKRKSAMMIFEIHAKLNYKFGNKHLLTEFVWIA